MSHENRQQQNRSRIRKVTQSLARITGGARNTCGRQTLELRSPIDSETTVSLPFPAYLGNSKSNTSGDILTLHIPRISGQRALLRRRERLAMVWSGEKINAYENRPFRNSK
jgi:hypothetical protein